MKKTLFSCAFGFSLMEMMIVMLIAAIIAAFTAPMINKKMVHSASGESPWSWVGNRGDITFGFAANPANPVTASIGATTAPNGLTPSLYLFNDSGVNPQLVLGHNNNANDSLKIFHRNNFLWMGTENPVYTVGAVVANGARIINHQMSGIFINPTFPVPNLGAAINGNYVTDFISIGGTVGYRDDHSVAVGIGSTTNGDNTVVIGDSAAGGNNAVAVGQAATANTQNSIAIGNNASATGQNSIAIGAGAGNANFQNSVALGQGVQNTANNQIMLGDNRTIVRIPGTLIVENLTVNNRLTLPPVSGFVDSGIVWRQGRGQDGLMPVNQFGTFLRVTNIPQVGNVIGFGDDLRNPLEELIGCDRRLKNVGEVFKGGLSEIRKLEVFNFTYKNDKAKTPRVGVMAQDLKKIFPDAVFKGEDGFFRIRMEDMFYAVINAIKELDRIITSHDKRIEALEEENRALVVEINELKARLDKLEKVAK